MNLSLPEALESGRGFYQEVVGSCAFLQALHQALFPGPKQALQIRYLPPAEPQLFLGVRKHRPAGIEVGLETTGLAALLVHLQSCPLQAGCGLLQLLYPG